MIRLALGVALVAAISACSPQVAADLVRTPAERCHDAVALYDEAPGVYVGVLTAATCAG